MEKRKSAGKVYVPELLESHETVACTEADHNLNKTRATFGVVLHKTQTNNIRNTVKERVYAVRDNTNRSS